MRKLICLLSAALILIGAVACNNEETVGLPDIKVNFDTTEIGLPSEEASEDIAVSLSRAADADLTVEVTFTTEGVEYGTHFTTTPAATASKLSVTISKGNNSGSFKVTKASGILLAGDESITFKIASVTGSDKAKPGDKTEAVLSFASIVSQGGEMTLEGNGADEAYLNSVYVDLSANKQTAVSRKSWNLGFWCGSEFRVVLNGAYATAATPSSKTDINAVTLADADAVEDAYNLNTNPMGATGLSETIFDSADGDITKTAFAEIAAGDGDNKVYFVASAPDKLGTRGDWYKVKVTRKGEGYSVQFGKVSGGAVKTIDIPKKEGYNFAFLSLESGQLVDVEPAAGKWDIKWSYDSGYATSMGAPMYMFMQDYVSINTWGGVSVAIVKTADVKYADFKEPDLAELTFDKNRGVIGDRWRSTGGMGGAGGVKTDHFYVVKDSDGLVYKLRFTRGGFSTSEGGVRGRPEIEYARVK